MSILSKWRNYVPNKYTPRAVQVELLDALASEWDSYDLFVVSLPTGGGKSWAAKAIMETLRDVQYIVPNNLLVNQVTSEFPDTHVLHRMDSYYCSYWKRPSAATKARLGSYCSSDLDCKGCRDIRQALKWAKYTTEPLLANYHISMAHKLARSTLIVDESHLMFPVIADRLGKTLWKHDLHYPDNMHSLAYVKRWVDQLPPAKHKLTKIRLLKESVISANPKYVFHRTTDLFNGKGTTRGRPEERDCIKLVPVELAQAQPVLWNPAQVKKVVLLSATISRKDVEELGLHRWYPRIRYLECKSPIPPENRPVRVLNWASVTHYSCRQPSFLRDLAAYLTEIVEAHPGERGVIHVTYQLAEQLKPLMNSPRLMFHTRDTKKQAYDKFRLDKTDKVLVASGMYEGIDLPGDLGRFQVIAKLPWKSLENPAIKHKMERDEEWYLWECMKTVIQACGRISRGENDYGISYIVDSTWNTLYSKCMARGLVPQWFTEGIQTDDLGST